MIKAAFSIEDYAFNQVMLDYSKYEDSDSVQVIFNPTGIYEEKERKYVLQLITIVQSETKEANPFLSVQCKAVFKFQADTSFADIPEFFYTNAIAILFPYIRAYISLITTQANVSGVILPTLNLAHLAIDLKKATTNI
jgi:preprotein translocase subunit SecB